MQFHTHIEIKPFERKIDHSQRILSLGSCFADNIAKRLQRSKFCVTASPTGILFNPESIACAIERFAEAGRSDNALPTKEELHHSNGVWFNYDFHSSFSHSDANVAVEQMREAVTSGAEALAKAEVVIITFGTAFAYRTEGRVIANCHKQPQKYSYTERNCLIRYVFYKNIIKELLNLARFIIFRIINYNSISFHD